MTMKNLVRLSKVNDHPNIPLRAATFYKWRHLRKCPELFIEFGGAVFIDMDRLDKVLEAGRDRG